jgi:hypothetical protein
MQVRYYAARIDVDDSGRVHLLHGAYPSYNEAMQVHVRHLERHLEVNPEPWSRGVNALPPVRPAVLLDLGSVAVQEDLQHAMLTDPVLSAIFELGRQVGRLES